jgi:hypothetical protein
MQQRRLRLGDILDDYCPRERRITNHAVVAMIEDEVKQTRCTTCDADHEYKQARVPVRRKKDGAALPGDPSAVARPRAATAAVPNVDVDQLEQDEGPQQLLDAPAMELRETVEPLVAAPAAAPQDAEAAATEDDAQPELEEDGPVHRRLIRATLPRPEGQQPEWKDPDFTIRQPGGSRGGFDGNRNGQRPGRGPRRAARPPGNSHSQPARFGGPRHGNNPRHGSGQPQGQGGNRSGGGRPGPGQGQGQNRGSRPGGPGRKRGR